MVALPRVADDHAIALQQLHVRFARSPDLCRHACRPAYTHTHTHTHAHTHARIIKCGRRAESRQAKASVPLRACRACNMYVHARTPTHTHARTGCASAIPFKNKSGTFDRHCLLIQPCASLQRSNVAPIAMQRFRVVHIRFAQCCANTPAPGVMLRCAALHCLRCAAGSVRGCGANRRAAASAACRGRRAVR